jgi:hypothetical protein
MEIAGTYDVGGTTTVVDHTETLAFVSGADVQSVGELLHVERDAILEFNTGDQIPLNDVRVEGFARITGDDPLRIKGQITGNGTIENDLVAEGTVAPGDSPGTLTVAGDLTQTSESVVEIEVDWNETEKKIDFDQLLVDGKADFEGVLEILPADDYDPQLGDSFEIMQFDAVEDVFAQYEGTALPDGLRFVPQVNEQSLALDVQEVPEPSSALCVLILSGLLYRRRRARAVRPGFAAHVNSAPAS